MAAFVQPVEQFIDTYINGNLEIVKIAKDDKEMDSIWKSLHNLEPGGFGIARANDTREYVVKQINIGGQIDRKGPLYAINNIRNEVLIYHYIAQKCVGVCSFIGCYYDTRKKLLYVKSKYCGLDFHSILFKPSFNHHIKPEIFGKIIDNLKCLHDNGVVYRDLKLENITISDDNTVTFIDFGLSYFCKHAAVPDELKMNQDENIIGTPLYGDPTRPINDEKDLTKTDTYSIGVLFAIMFSKKKYLDLLLNSNFNGKPFMYRVENLSGAYRASFWTGFNKNIKKILGSEINHTHFFGGFNIRLTSADLQYAFQQKNQLDQEVAKNIEINSIPGVPKYNIKMPTDDTPEITLFFEKSFKHIPQIEDENYNAVNNGSMQTLWDTPGSQSIGEGNFGEVRLIRGNAIKQIDILKLKSKRPYYYEDIIKNEIITYSNISTICSDLVCHFIGYYYNNVTKQLYIETDYCGTELLKTYMNEQENHVVINHIGQILKIVQCLHNNGIAHRDLKLENFTIDEHDKIRLIDFGTCVNVKEDNGEQINKDGTILYLAREFLNIDEITISSDLFAGDIYSLGLMFLLMVIDSNYINDINEVSDKHNNAISLYYIFIELANTKGTIYINGLFSIFESKMNAIFYGFMADYFFNDNPKKRVTIDQLVYLFNKKMAQNKLPPPSNKEPTFMPPPPPSNTQRNSSAGGKSARRKKKCSKHTMRISKAKRTKKSRSTRK